MLGEQNQYISVYALKSKNRRVSFLKFGVFDIEDYLHNMFSEDFHEDQQMESQPFRQVLLPLCLELPYCFFVMFLATSEFKQNERINNSDWKNKLLNKIDRTKGKNDLFK